MDNVATLGVESCVLDELEKLIVQENIKITDEQKLARLASESEESRAKRLHIETKLQNLRTALEKCKDHEKRRVCIRNYGLLSETRNGASGRSSHVDTPKPLFKFQNPSGLTPQPRPASVAAD